MCSLQGRQARANEEDGGHAMTTAHIHRGDRASFVPNPLQLMTALVLTATYEMLILRPSPSASYRRRDWILEEVTGPGSELVNGRVRTWTCRLHALCAQPTPSSSCFFLLHEFIHRTESSEPNPTSPASPVRRLWLWPVWGGAESLLWAWLPSPGSTCESLQD